MTIDFQDHSAEVLAALHEASLRALEKCGLTAEGYAKKLCIVDTGLLRNSITHAISGEAPSISEYESNSTDKHGRPVKVKKGKYEGTAPTESDGSMAVYIGTNVEYAPYIEMGTGKKNTPGGRDTPWAYPDAKGKYHRTTGSKAHPFIKPAVADHAQTYKKIIEDELKGG